MTQTTTNYNLVTYNDTVGGDDTSTFKTFRTDVAGVTNSNMTKIDAALVETVIALQVFDYDEDWVLEDGAFYYTIPPELNGRLIDEVYAFCYTASTSGTPTIQISKGRRASATSSPSWSEVLSTRITIDINEFSSTDATTQPVINLGNNDLDTRDIIRIDIDNIGTGTKGLEVSLKLV